MNSMKKIWLFGSLWSELSPPSVFMWSPPELERTTVRVCVEHKKEVGVDFRIFIGFGGVSL